ncbi:MAG TPA: glycosyltransferase family A protein, partial [Candidatus Saccharimonadales bacterium]|nr:glycosyltransferase family A protein [Candidatus Saccharimonadales bacterium]
ERHLSACLKAIGSQAVAPYEVLVIDNNSTDKTVEIARSFPFVRVIPEAKQGIVFARTAGFDAARGDIIGRIDADITLPSDWIEHVQDFYSDKTHRNIAWTGLGRFYNVRLGCLVNWTYELVGFRFNRLLLRHYPLWGSSMAITANQWERVRDGVCRRTDIHEDLDLAIHLHDAGFQIFYDKKVKVWAELRRVRSNRHELWGYLEWLPRTFRIHGKKTWPLVWFVGTFLIYLAALGLAVVDYTARRFRISS